MSPAPLVPRLSPPCPRLYEKRNGERKAGLEADLLGSAELGGGGESLSFLPWWRVVSSSLKSRASLQGHHQG